MAFRFRKSLPVIPGVKLNLNKRGVSVTAGVRGAKVTVGSKGTTATLGLPGTGMSWSRYTKNGTASAIRKRHPRVPARQAREMMLRALHTEVIALPNNTMHGPVSLSLILRLIASGTYPEDTLVRVVGSADDDWEPLPEEIIDMAHQYVMDEDGAVRLRWLLGIMALIAAGVIGYLVSGHKFDLSTSFANPPVADAGTDAPPSALPIPSALSAAQPFSSATPVPSSRATPSISPKAAAENERIRRKYGDPG